MEIRRDTGHHQQRQSFHAPAVVGTGRELKASRIEAEYRRLKLRLRATAGTLYGVKLKARELQSKLWQAEMSGECIMLCRDYIDKKLGVDAVHIPGLQFNSPFFDDLIYSIVDRVKHQDAMLQQNASAITHWQSLANQLVNTISSTNSVWISNSTSTSANTYTPSLGIMPLVTTSVPYAATVGTTVNFDIVDTLDDLKISDGRKQKITLPDGAILDVKRDGSYKIEDKDAKVIYRANRVREFNRYINASDLLAEFISFCGKEAQVNRGEMLDLPLRLFVAYLVIESAKADQAPEPDDIKLIPDVKAAVSPVCAGCGQPLSISRRMKKIGVCNAACLEIVDQEEFAEVA